MAFGARVSYERSRTGGNPELASYLRIEERELEADAYLMRSYANPLMAPGAFRGYAR